MGHVIHGLAALELALDDLLLLFDEVFDAPHHLGKKEFPATLSDKTKALLQVADAVDLQLDIERVMEISERLVETRNRIVHGKVTTIRGSIDGYTVQFVKVSRLRKQHGLQMLRRNPEEITSRDFHGIASDVGQLRVLVRELTKRVFASAQGWPTTTPVPEYDGLNSDNLLETMKQYA